MSTWHKRAGHPAVIAMLAIACAGSGRDSNGQMPADAATSDFTSAHCGAPVAGFGIRVCGNSLVDNSGQIVQLRGVNVAGLEGVAIQGWDPADPWGENPGGPKPDWSAIKRWGANSVRLPLNEASWLALRCVDYGGYGSVFENGVKVPNKPGQTVEADPGRNYQRTVEQSVAEATQAGLYVILDLHLSAPHDGCPNAQNAMADSDHSLAFWSSLAGTFKSNPAVLFELFNEPFLSQAPLEGAQPWEALVNGGGTISSFAVQGKVTAVEHAWHLVGMQQLLATVRGTGATNVVLISTIAYASAIDGWLTHHPIDPLNPSQIAAVWHAYPGTGYPRQVNCLGLPSCSQSMMAGARKILAGGYPVVITEYADTVGGAGAPFASMLLPFADANDIGYLAWTWDTWIGTQYYLISDGTGHPSAGYGTYVREHYLCRAERRSSCP